MTHEQKTAWHGFLIVVVIGALLYERHNPQVRAWWGKLAHPARPSSAPVRGTGPWGGYGNPDGTAGLTPGAPPMATYGTGRPAA